MIKKLPNWLLNAAFVLIIVVTLAPVIIGALTFILLLVLIKTDEIDTLSQSKAANIALQACRLSAYVENTSYPCMTIGNSLTAFEIPWYFNHVDNKDLREVMLTLMAVTDGWHVESVTDADYAAHLPTESSFLLPETSFDAWFESVEDRAFYDHESGLFVHLREGEVPKPGIVRADKLTVPHDGFLYEMETHGGFFGDGTTYQALIVPEAERPALEATLSSHADWHEGSITHAEYITLHGRKFYEVPQLYPAADVTFDWWCYVDTFARAHPNFERDHIPDNSFFLAVMRETGARPSGNWLVALYDADSGLFIFYQYDS